MAERKVKPTREKLTAHGLLGALSYWGTTARMLLAAVIVGFAFAVNLTGGSGSLYIDTEIMFLIYGLATILILDMGYVVAARALPLNKMVDRWIVMLGDLLLAGFFVVPSIVIMSADGNKVRIISLIVALLVVSLRALIGLLFSKRK